MHLHLITLAQPMASVCQVMELSPCKYKNGMRQVSHKPWWEEGVELESYAVQREDLQQASGFLNLP